LSSVSEIFIATSGACKIPALPREGLPGRTPSPRGARGAPNPGHGPLGDPTRGGTAASLDPEAAVPSQFSMNIPQVALPLDAEGGAAMNPHILGPT